MGQIKTIELQNSVKWNEIVKSFRQFDVYYLSNYVTAFKMIGDGEPILLYYEDDELRGINVVMKRDISLFRSFHKLIPSQTYFDIVTPYGYGGFIFEGNITTSTLNTFYNNYLYFLNNQNIISEFVRYHPLLKNADAMRSISNVIDLGKTISIDMSSKEIIWANIKSKNRNMIRKAQKNNVEICHQKNFGLFKEFMSVYNLAMERDNASPYYFFDENFYRTLDSDLKDNYEMFYAVWNNKIIAMSIVIFANNKMHYHLSGTYFEYRDLAPTNLLLYEAACWGMNEGYKVFHLGGGLGSGEDNLYKFKQAFNLNSNNRFSIGKTIYNNTFYEYLVEIRRKDGTVFNTESSFFPLYRFEHH